jgi:hypothetical protein
MYYKQPQPKFFLWKLLYGIVIYYIVDENHVRGQTNNQDWPTSSGFELLAMILVCKKHAMEPVVLIGG